jgi:Fic family protein
VAGWLRQTWRPNLDAGTRAGRRGGTFQTYLPDLLATRPVVLDAAVTARAAEVEATVRELTAGPQMRVLEGLSRFMLRSEAIASSRIEGMQASPQQIALAELAQTDVPQAKGFTRNARFVANNITALRKAATELAEASSITIDGIDELHRSLLPDERHHGLRTVQNWIGGSDWHPIDADFVPPPPERVPDLMADLVGYLNGGLHAPLVQAALAHAQFETIHPYTDGNGRVGRALIHTVLTRRGLTPTAVLPVSLVLLTRSNDYLAGLTAYRYDGPADGTDAANGFATWLGTFLVAAEFAVEQVTKFTAELAELRVEWHDRLTTHRRRQGITSTPRANSASARLIELLPQAPLLTARTVQRLLTVSFPAAKAALEGLAEADILTRKNVERGTTGYFARDVFDLLTFAERRLASTRWDTRKSPPVRSVPARPNGNAT